MMNKLSAILLCFGLTTCHNQKPEQASISPGKVHGDSVAAQTTIPEKEKHTTTYSGNAVNKLSGFINCILQDVHGIYWFASNNDGVYGYDGASLFQFTVKDGLCDNQVFTIQEDKEHNIWFLTAAGISRFDGKKFATFPEKGNRQLSDGKKTKTAATDALWFEFGGGAYYYDGSSFSYVLLPKPDSKTKYINTTNPQSPDAQKLNPYSVYCSFKDKKGNLWFGTQTLGVCRYDGKIFTWFTESGLKGPAVRALFEDSRGNLWFGNNGNGLFQYNGETLSNFSEKHGLGNPEFVKTGKSIPGTLARVWTVNEDDNGNIWIGTYDAGVWRYDGVTLTNYTTKDGLISNTINTIYKDNNGTLWFGTDGAGVCKFNGTSFSAFTVR